MRKKHIKAKKDRRDFIKKTGVSLGSLFVLPSQILFGKKEIKDVTGKVTQKPLTLPELPKEFEGLEIDTTSKTSEGMIKPKPNTLRCGKDLTLKVGSHHRTLSAIPNSNGKDIQTNLAEYFKSDTNHFMNFLNAARGKEKTLSPFKVSAPLSQVFCLGTIAQQLNRTIKFDKKTKTITNNDFANRLLKEHPPRKGWEEFYKMA